MWPLAELQSLPPGPGKPAVMGDFFYVGRESETHPAFSKWIKPIMPQYIRAFVPGGTFFFTVTLLERRRELLIEHINDLRKAFKVARQHRPFTVEAIVILPDHLHSIWTLPSGDADFSSRWHDIKALFAAKIPAGERLSGRRLKKGGARHLAATLLGTCHPRRTRL